MYTVPLYFRVTQNSSNTVAGSHLFPAVLGNTVGGLLAGFVIQKTGKYKFLTILSSISSMTAYLLLIFRWKGNTSWLESMAIVPGGFGTGIAFSAAFIAMTSEFSFQSQEIVEADVLLGSVKRTDIAIATSGGYLVSAIGMLIGIASASAVQLASLRLILENGLSGIEGSKILIEKVISDVSSIANIEEGLKKIVIDGYVKSLEYSHSKYLIRLRGCDGDLQVCSGFSGFISSHANHRLYHPRETSEMIGHWQEEQKLHINFVSHNFPRRSENDCHVVLD
jgi:hypothetical protein